MQCTHPFTTLSSLSFSLCRLSFLRLFIPPYSPPSFFNPPAVSFSRPLSFFFLITLAPPSVLVSLSLARSLVATVASDTVSNGSGGHTILRLNSTDTAVQRRLLSYSFHPPLYLSTSFSFSLFLSLLLSSAPFSASFSSDRTPSLFSSGLKNGSPYNNTHVRIERLLEREIVHPEISRWKM